MPEGELFEVERLVAKRKVANNRVEYLVRWKGYTKRHDTWEPLANLDTCMDLVQAFNAERRAKLAGQSEKNSKQIPQSKKKFVQLSKSNKSKTGNSSFHPAKAVPAQSDDFRRTDDGRPTKRTAPRMIEPLLSKRAKKALQPRSRSSSPSPRSPRHRPEPRVNVTPISARAYSNFLAKDDERKLQNGFIHTSPPSVDHEYFSTPYKPRRPSWIDKFGLSPTSEHDDTDIVFKTEKDDIEGILDVEPAQTLLAPGYSTKSLEKDKMDSETLGRKLTLRGGISRSKHLHVLKRGNCTEIILSNELERNAMSPEILDEFSRLLDDLATGPSTMVLFSAVGDFFCSGFDLKYLVGRIASAANVSAAVKSCAASVRNFINCLIDFPKPLVAMVQGPAIGLGCAILPHFDTVYSSDRAYFATPYSEMGQTPEACSSYLFPQIVGRSVANDMLLNGITLTAIEAKSVGLISDVYLHDSLKRNVLPILKSLSVKSREALVATKELIRTPQRARLKYINQCEYLALRQRWEDKDTLKYILQYTSTYNHIS